MASCGTPAARAAAGTRTRDVYEESGAKTENVFFYFLLLFCFKKNMNRESHLIYLSHQCDK